MLQPFVYHKLIQNALKEDMSWGDLTSFYTINDRETGRAQLIAQADGLLCGKEIFEAVFHEVSPTLECSWLLKEGEAFSAGELIGSFYGKYSAMLTAQQVALNFLQRMSGIATATRQAVDLLADSPTRITDTRRTAPGIRYLDKYAVYVGGGHNHRANLSDGVVISHNHVLAGGGLIPVLDNALQISSPHLSLQVEVCNLEEAQIALSKGIRMLLTFSSELHFVRELCQLAKGKADVEVELMSASPEDLLALAHCGVQYIALSSLTSAVRPVAMKFSLCQFEEAKKPEGRHLFSR